MSNAAYFEELPARDSWSDEGSAYWPCDDPGPYRTRCTERADHRYSHYDASDDSSWQDDWRDYAPEDDEDD